MHIILDAAAMFLYRNPLEFCLIVGMAALIVFLWLVHQAEQRGWLDLT